MRTKILSILRDADSHVSGQELSRRLGVTRTAVWKNIQILKEEGYQFEAVQNKGYRILEIPDTIHASEIESRITNTRINWRIHYIEETSSTNTWVRRLAEEGAPSGTLAITDNQTQGRGRRGRGWLSPKGSDICMSMLLRPDFLPLKAPMMTLVMGLSVVQGIEQVTGLKGQLKWPNDVVIKGKKVCGILTEMSAQIDYLEHLVIGVGINCNTRIFPEELQNQATSLAIERGENILRAGIVAAVLKRFDSNYNRFLETLDLSPLLENYNEILINRDKEVRVLGLEESYTGIARGINQQGELLVETADGQMNTVFAGEVSIRGLYGYAE